MNKKNIILLTYGLITQIIKPKSISYSAQKHVCDTSMTKIILNQSRIYPASRKKIATSMPEHVWMNLRRTPYLESSFTDDVVHLLMA